MPRRPGHAKKASPGSRFYCAAKITDYQFKRVLWHFVLDDTVRETARHVRLSENSIAAIFAKLRRFFFRYGLFNDPYEGRDPAEGFGDAALDEAEHRILTFHLARLRRRRKVIHDPDDEPDYLLAESQWRFNYMMSGRAAETLHPMMYARLMEFIRSFGPVGAPHLPTPEQRKAGLTLALEQFDRMLLWLERSAPLFRNSGVRAATREIRTNSQVKIKETKP